jgi:hypothetical protein
MSDIDQILYPTVLSSLREDTPPVNCIIWRGNDDYETITFDKVYPFDTIDDIKRMICNYYKDDKSFIPRFTFVGIPYTENPYSTEHPTIDTTYIPIDYLWYPNGVNDPRMTYILNNPRKTLLEPDLRFISSDGSYSSPNFEARGRSTIEDVFLKLRNGKIPTLHVFPLKYVLNAYIGPSPIGEEDWNKRFAPYYPNVKIGGPYEADEDDIEFAKKITFFIEQREKTINTINNFLEEGIDVPTIKISGIRQLRLTWKKPVKGFEGCGYMFYRLQVTEKRPYIRLIPSEGTSITKLHVKGVLPIPTLDDPRILEIWGKETTPTPGIDFCTIKYIHRPSIGITQPIYGTVRTFNDGTVDLLLQPPKQIRKLDPNIDFRNFTTIINDIFTGLPQSFDNFQLGELSVLFTLKIGIKSQRFNKQRILKRLPYFQTFFQEIKSLPDENPLISLRYKAVSQYASEDKIFSFITQLATEKTLNGENPSIELINAIQTEFQLSKRESVDIMAEWFRKKGTFTLQAPEEGEFIESYNPGIDIHIYAQHPSYYFHINRIDNYETYTRIYTLLSLLFIEEDDYFTGITGTDVNTMESITSELESESLGREETTPVNTRSNTEGTAIHASTLNGLTPNDTNAISIPDLLMDDPFANISNAVNEGEVLPETAPNPVTASTVVEETTTGRPVVVNKSSKEPEIGKTVHKIGDEQKLIDPKSWFIKKLQEIDPRLFNFKTGDKDENGYSRKCAGFDDRQPSVLSKDQYDRMREVYEDDNIFWIIYPLEGKDEPIQPLGTEETITVMKYGSDSDNVNYYFCPQYYCLSDEIMVRPVDFESTTDRDGNPKSPNTCPFCYGKLITDRKKALPGYTVIKRKDKKGATYHSYVDFMTKTTHPEKFALPCCFLKQTTLRISDEKYSHLRSYLQDSQIDDVVDNKETEEDEDTYDSLVFRGDDAIEYAVLFESIQKKYIIESNKHPDPGVFAIISPQFDAFFRQNSSERIITRVAIHLRLRPNAQGFLRIGTENTVYESLLGVIAPLMYRNSINEVRERILEVVTPRIFLNSHFGNLVLEFYNPADGSAMPPTKQELMSWCQKYLGVSVNSTNLYASLRLYNSYKRFIRFIRDPSQRKDLRHIQPLLAEPGLFTTNGIQLIIMEDNGDEPITIKCPVFGVSMDRNRKNDFAFISRSLKNIATTQNKYAKYELYLHTSNKPAKGGESEIHETIIRWDYNSRRFWPEIVKTRIDEYMTQCQSRHRSIYTSQEGVNPMAMIPLSKAVEASPFRPEGIVKDSYNHIVGLTFRSKPGASTLVALPIVDDGVISISSAFSIKSIYLDWDDFKPAYVEDIVKYYKENLEPLFALYPGYNIEYIVRQKMDNRIIAVQLKNGIYIPALPPKSDTALSSLGLNIVDVDYIEWSIDKDILGLKTKINTNSWDKVINSSGVEKSCGSDSELSRKSTYVQFEELYQQFRLMVSNWITSQKAGSEVRKGIEDIIFSADLPEFEKRKRLYIFISSTFLSWFYPDEDKWEAPASLLRKDCRLIDTPDACTGTCFWKEENEGGKCLLHVNSKTQLGDKEGERDVSTPELFTKRVIDELVRFPVRRKQLMKRGEISKVSQLTQPIRQGDQYIIPESSPSWTNLLRLDWARQIPEEHKYYEEMSRENTYEDDIPPEGELPDALKAILGTSTKLRLKLPEVYNESQPLIPFTGILGVSLEQIGAEDDAKTLTRDNLIKYVVVTSTPIGLIDTTEEDDIKIQFIRPSTGSFDRVTIFVFMPDKTGLLIEEEGNPTVKIDNLPESIKDKWKSAGIVQLKKKIAVPSPESEVKPPLIIGQNPITQQTRRRRPLIATSKEAPLEVKKSKPTNTTRRKPRIAPSALPPETE